MSRYLDLFLAESRDHLGAAYDIRSRLDREADRATWQELLRHAHSLKGMAATMGYGSMVALAHAVEDLAERLQDAAPDELAEHLSALGQGLDGLGQLIDRIERGESAEIDAAEDLARLLRARIPRSAPAGTIVPVSPATGDESPGEAGPPEQVWSVVLHFDRDHAVRAEWTVLTLGHVSGLGRVVQAYPPLLALDSGEFEGRLRLVLASRVPCEELELRLEDLDGIVSAEIGPHEAARLLPAADPGGPSWIRVRADLLDTLAEQLLQLRLDQGRLKTEIPGACEAAQHRLQRTELELEAAYGTLMELRLVPFGSIAQRLQQLSGEMGRQLGKEHRLEIVGGDVRLDRSVLDALVDPLTHVVRNALDHGIESGDDRRAAGKDPRAHLQLSVERLGDRVNVIARDDGRGINPRVLRNRAVETGILDRGTAEGLSDPEVLRLATLPGFTTASAVTEISGRGVGLDVVNERIEALGGLLAIESVPGTGTTIRMTVPLRLALVRTVLVRVAGELFAAPIETVHRTARLSDAFSPDAPTRAMDLVRLDRRLRCEADQDATTPWVLCVETEERSVGLVVDEVVGRRDVVVKPFRSPLAHLREYTGAAILDDGAIALVLDTLYLADALRTAGTERR